MSETHSIRIMIAEDHLIARAGVGAIVNVHPDMKVVAEAVNGEQAVAQYREHRPDVTLMDIRMPVLGGVEAISMILHEFADAKVIALSTFGGDEDIRRALSAGARAYLTKGVLHDELIAAIRAVHAGQTYLTKTAASVLSSQRSHIDLSAREREVLRLIVDGLTNKQIAFNLGIAEDTAKNHVKSILKKLGVTDRTQAATEAIQRGIIHLHT